MSSRLIEFSLFLLGLGFSEVVIKPIVTRYFRKSLLLLPDIFDKLDPLMPRYISECSPEEMREMILNVIGQSAEEGSVKLSEREKQKLFKEFVRQYDPMKATIKVKK
jgi:hypothetical protein